MRPAKSLLILFLLFAAAAFAAVSVVPQPASVRELSGSFRLQRSTVVSAGPDVRPIALQFIQELESQFSLPVRFAAEPRRSNGIWFVLDNSVPEEGYRLKIEKRGITITGRSAGLFYGTQTLLQLLQANRTTHAMEITDQPRFPYRGLHLDTSRHFYSVDFLKHYIDWMARYKLNRFHWHLTDDQGWRLEIRKYPKLTEIGSTRKETVVGHAARSNQFDGKPYGGFYTQAQVRDVLEYASRRFITVIPEIEMPGHASAALAAYPQLGCTPGPFEVATTWGVFKDVFCPKEETFAFLQGVLAEVIELFPSQYIHIGGDECPKDRWKESDVAQEVMRREGLKDENQLQSYFIRRIEKFINSKGRRIIGWDEILEGGLAPDATVMSWRGEKGGMEAAAQHHSVIMTPVDYVYFDYYQGNQATEPLAIGNYLPLEKVYSYNPLPEALPAGERKYILGSQANVWTEYMPQPRDVEYMIFPRLLALAELVWTPQEQRNYTEFLKRVPEQLDRLKREGVAFRPLEAAAPAAAR